jgi:hypothetical protein
MGQRNEVEFVTGIFGGERCADNFIEFSAGHELEDGEFADGDNEAWAEEIHFGFEPAGAVEDFIGSRDAVASGRSFSGKATTDRRHVDARPESFFIHTGVVIEPAEEFFAGGPGEGTAQDRLLVAGGLSDDDHAAGHCAAADDGLLHLRATSAAEEGQNVIVELSLEITFDHEDEKRPATR